MNEIKGSMQGRVVGLRHCHLRAHAFDATNTTASFTTLRVIVTVIWDVPFEYRGVRGTGVMVLATMVQICG